MKKAGKWVAVFAGAIVIVFLLRGFLFTSYIIPSSGMENALYSGDRIIVNKWSYGLRVPCMAWFSYHRWLTRPVYAGDIVVFNNPASTSQPIIDKRKTFIGRCIGTPGDTLTFDSLYTVSSSPEKSGPDRKLLYAYPKDKETQMDSLLILLAINKSTLIAQKEEESIRSFSRYEYYLLEQALLGGNWITPLQEQDMSQTLVIPGKGKKIQIHRWNATLLRNTVVLHEGVKADVKNDTLYVNGNPVNEYTFTQDYYWMASNNTINLADSRLFGLVPYNHIIGKAAFIWFSKEPGTNWLKGYRWDRFFRPAR